jgi:hypothetical protein
MEKYIISGIILGLWSAYAELEGSREGYLYDAITRSNKKYVNIHWIFFLQRGFVLLIIGALLHTFVLPIALALIFPYFHDGAYYCQRNDIESSVYPKRWKDSSTTSTAFFEFNYAERCGLVVVGLLIFVGYLYLLYLKQVG